MHLQTSLYILHVCISICGMQQTHGWFWEVYTCALEGKERSRPLDSLDYEMSDGKPKFKIKERKEKRNTKHKRTRPSPAAVCGVASFMIRLASPLSHRRRGASRIAPRPPADRTHLGPRQALALLGRLGHHRIRRLLRPFRPCRALGDSLFVCSTGPYP